MTRQEKEAELQQAYLKGDIEARNELIELIKPYIYTLVRRYKDTEDKFQQALLIAIEELPKFDPDRGRLTTFIHYVVRARMQNYIASDRLVRIPTSIYKEKRAVPTEIRTNNISEMLTVDRKEYESIEEQQLKRAVAEALEDLENRSNFQVKIVLDFLDSGGNYGWCTEAAKKFGYTKQRMEQIKSAFIEKVKQKLPPALRTAFARVN